MTTPPTVVYAAIPGDLWDRDMHPLPPPRPGSEWLPMHAPAWATPDMSPNCVVYTLHPYAGTMLCVAYRAHGATATTYARAEPQGDASKAPQAAGGVGTTAPPNAPHAQSSRAPSLDPFGYPAGNGEYHYRKDEA